MICEGVLTEDDEEEGAPLAVVAGGAIQRHRVKMLRMMKAYACITVYLVS